MNKRIKKKLDKRQGFRTHSNRADHIKTLDGWNGLFKFIFGYKSMRFKNIYNKPIPLIAKLKQMESNKEHKHELDK